MAGFAVVGPSGNPYIDGLLVGRKWTSGITYNFPTDPNYYASDYFLAGGAPLYTFDINAIDNQLGAGTFAPASAAIMAAYAVLIPGQFAGTTNLDFTLLGATDTVDVSVARVLLPNDNQTGTITGHAYQPGGVQRSGDTWYSTEAYYGGNPANGNFFEEGVLPGGPGWFVMLHEIGHSIGLKHAHEPGLAVSTVVPLDRDSFEYTVMTYRDFVGAPADRGGTAERYGRPQTLMSLDIQAIQYLYGADFEANAGNTVYTFSPTTGQMFIDGVGELAPGANRIFRTIWDGNGVDTYDLSNYTTNLSIDLEPGAWSTFSQGQLAILEVSTGRRAVGNVSNALQYQGDPRSLIENAVGGIANDVLSGNIIANALDGGAGDDRLNGRAGDDRLKGGAGADLLFGDEGSDTAIFDGYSSDYQVIDTFDGFAGITDLRAGSPDGADLARDVEFYEFHGIRLTAAEAFNNVLATIGAPTVASVTENTTSTDPTLLLVADGTIAVNDIAPEAFLREVLPASGNLGTLALTGPNAYHYEVANGAVAFLDEGETRVDTFAVRTGDGILHNVSFTIHGADTTIFGQPGQFIVNGTDEREIIVLGQDNIYSNAGDGNDTVRILAGPSVHIVNGGGGRDTIDFSGADGGSGLDINLATGLVIGPSIGATVLYSIENADGSAAGDRIHAGATVNVMTGEDGADYFDFDSLNAARNGSTFDAAARDVIRDFQDGVDRIDLSGIDAVRGGGNNAFQFNPTAWDGTGAEFTAAGQLRYHYETDANGVEHTIISGNIDSASQGNGLAADFQIDLLHRQTLTASDFLL